LKKAIGILLLSVLLLATLVSCGVPNQADDAVLCKDADGNYYILSNDGKTFIYYLPSNNRPLYKGARFTVPEGVERIAKGAFWQSPKILTMASTVHTIEDGAFPYQSGLVKLTIPASVTSYREGNQAVFVLTEELSLTEVELLCDVEKFCFLHCGLISLTITEASVPKIWNEMTFERCYGLQSISVVGQETKRDMEFEEYCAQINDYPVLYIPEGAEELLDSVIYSKVNLYLPDSIKSISKNVYAEERQTYKTVVSVPAHATVGEDGTLSGKATVIVRK